MPTGSMSLQELMQVVETMTTMVAQWQSRDDGGWSVTAPVAGARSDTDVWTTAEVLQWLMQKDVNAYRDRIAEGLRYLLDMQHTSRNNTRNGTMQIDGGWGWKLESESDATATTLALRALTRHAQLHIQERSQYMSHVQAMRDGRDWLLRHVKPDGGISLTDRQPNSTAYNTCWGGIALLSCLEVPELKQPTIEAAIIPGMLSLLENNLPPAGWGNVIVQRPDALGVAYCTYFLLYLKRRSDDHPETYAGRRWLQNNQEDDGRWDHGQGPSAIESTSWAVIALLASGDNPDSIRIQSAINYLSQAYLPQRGWPARPDGEPQVWTTYCAVQAIQAYINAAKAQHM